MSSRDGASSVTTPARGETYLALATVAVFLLVRLALLIVREPFFDELFTVWMAQKPFAGILPALRLDSGPPLYYFLARIPNVFALRALSLLFATGALLIVLMRRSLGPGRLFAAMLLAVYPPAVLFAVDARAYALCGLFVTLGIVAVREKRPFGAAMAFLLAAYTHWYGALFLPLVLLAGSSSGTGENAPNRRVRAAGAYLGACVLFLPGLWLALRQPAEATEWLSGQNPLAVLGTFAFTGQYAEALFASPSLLLTIFSGIVLIAALAGSRTLKGTFAPFVLVPAVLAFAFALGGRTVYFPMRFDSVVAVPLMLWVGTSLQQWQPRIRTVLLVLLIACGAFVTVAGISDHARRATDPYREAAGVLREKAKPGEKIVATGFLYLEATEALGPGRVESWPAEQSRHPGWRVMRRTDDPLPLGPFLWIGERAAPEYAEIYNRRTTSTVFANDRAIIVRVE